MAKDNRSNSLSLPAKMIKLISLIFRSLLSLPLSSSLFLLPTLFLYLSSLRSTHAKSVDLV